MADVSTDLTISTKKVAKLGSVNLYYVALSNTTGSAITIAATNGTTFPASVFGLVDVVALIPCVVNANTPYVSISGGTTTLTCSTAITIAATTGTGTFYVIGK